MTIAYSPGQLSAISAVLARSAAITEWGGAGKEGGKIEEIQCMVFNKQLYIAGNHAESARVLALLNAFGVQGQGTFEKCLGYCHWLLSVRSNERSDKVGQAYGHELSDSELKAIALAGEDRPHYALTTLDQAEVKALVQAKQVTGDARAQTLQAFLRKFVGLDALVERKAQKNRSGVGVTLVKDVSSAVTSINVLSDPKQVHAELKLLAHVYRCRAQGGAAVTLQLGGLKKACTNCAKWMEYFHKLTALRALVTPSPNHASITAQTPDPDTRPTGSGAGLRPECDTSGDVKLAQQLFNGAANNASADLADAAK